jgi:hypothetical protein
MASFTRNYRFGGARGQTGGSCNVGTTPTACEYRRRAGQAARPTDNMLREYARPTDKMVRENVRPTNARRSKVPRCAAAFIIARVARI